MAKNKHKLHTGSLVLKDSRSSEYNIRRFANSNDPILLNIIFLHDIYDHHGRYVGFFEQILNNLPFATMIHTFDLHGQGLSVGHRGDLEDFGNYTEPLNAILSSIDSTKENSSGNIVLMGIGLGALIILRFLEMNDTNMTSRISGFIVMNPLLRFHEKLKLESDPGLLLPISTIRLTLNFTSEEMIDNVANIREYDGDLLNLKFMTKRKYEIIKETASKVRHASYFINNPSLFLISGDDLIYDQNVSKLFFKGLNSSDARVVNFDSTKHDLVNSKRVAKVISLMTKWLTVRRKDI